MASDPPENATLTGVPGILVGHAEEIEHQTGCTAILCPEGAVCGVDVRAFAPGSIETALLNPEARLAEVHGVLLTGGSAFGLAAAAGMVRWLAERGYGVETAFARVPLVPGAVIYDLNFNQSYSKPDFDTGYRAADAANDHPVVQGCVGAGLGATCGKMAGFHRAMKSGLGSSLIRYGELFIGAMAVVNPLGDVYDPANGTLLAGVRTEDGRGLAGTDEVIRAMTALFKPPETSHTVLGLVATNARLSKVQTSRVARMASAGIARAVRPAHLIYDGDTVFALATGRGPEGDESIIGALGADALAKAIVAGVLEATSAPDYPALRDL